MSINLLDTLRGFLNPDIVDKAASYLGESTADLQKGLDVVVPASLAAVVNKAETGHSASLLTMARDAYQTGILNKLPETFSRYGGGVPAESPTEIMALFGDKFGGLANAVSDFTGLKGSSSSALFGSIVPLVLALIGRYAKDNNATPGGIASLLTSQKSSILAALPAGFNLASFLGMPRVSEAAGTQHASAEPAKSGNRWLLPLILLLLALALLWYFLKGCNNSGDAPAAVHDTLVQTQHDTLRVGEELIKVTLPNGEVLEAYQGGIEDLLVAFLKDSAAKAGKDNWFDFNDLNFEFGTANIIPESRKELDNMVKILQAFPGVKIKIGGYTDRVGDAASNKRLSQQRAEAVAQALKDAGVESQVVGAEGYGDEFAKYPASAPEENRIKDRRVSVSVREK